MPKLLASYCCTSSWNWWRRAGRRATRGLLAAVSDMRLLRLGVAVGFFADDGGLLEIIGGRRGGCFPLEALGAPGIRTGDRSVADGPKQIYEGNEITDSEDGGASR